MRQTPYYECHITVTSLKNNEAQDERAMKELLSKCEGWHFSKITDDPLLGLGSKMYATAHFDAGLSDGTYHGGPRGLNLARLELNQVVFELQRVGFAVVRKKIECVVFDELVMKG